MILKLIKNKKTLKWVIIASLVFLAIYLFIPQPVQKPGVKGKYAELIKEGVLYHIEHALDGDTFIANVSGHEVKVRLIGMDTPEVVDPRRPVQCFGPEASARGKELLNGKSVYIEIEKGREAYDKYGRVLAYAKFPDGMFYNKYMIEEGYAREYTFNKEKYMYQKDFKEAQKKAQKEKRGLWGKCDQKLPK